VQTAPIPLLCAVRSLPEGHAFGVLPA